jgi:spermidine synthase
MKASLDNQDDENLLVLGMSYDQAVKMTKSDDEKKLLDTHFNFIFKLDNNDKRKTVLINDVIKFLEEEITFDDLVMKGIACMVATRN